MDKTFYFKYDRFENGEHRWVTNCGFCDEPENNRFYLSEGDWDGNAGDLDEWLFFSYEQVPDLTKLLTDKYPFWKNYELSEDAIKFKEGIQKKEIKDVFTMIYLYCIKDNGSMNSFKKLLGENNIKSEYSCYRSSADW